MKVPASAKKAAPKKASGMPDVAPKIQATGTKGTERKAPARRGEDELPDDIPSPKEYMKSLARSLVLVTVQRNE
ncbi:hypothetical protein LTR08_002446 [Meristemomyces frigidus]|nr:hypothetical protein LTR08_002446 [Meristemomyces frigidus]